MVHFFFVLKDFLTCPLLCSSYPPSLDLLWSSSFPTEVQPKSPSAGQSVGQSGAAHGISSSNEREVGGWTQGILDSRCFDV